MSRLTIKDKEIRNNFNAEYAKLADLEDIEDEWKTDLLTILKASNNGIYTNDYGYIESKDLVIWHGDLYYQTSSNIAYIDMFTMRNYGKTWALTKEELKDE